MASSLHRESEQADWRSRTMTLHEFTHENPLPDARTELVSGRMIVREPPKERHGIVTARMMGVLFQYFVRTCRSPDEIGTLLCNDVGILLQREPPTVRASDLAYYLPARLSRNIDEYSTEVPDLIVEVRSRTDKPGYLRKKVREWQEGGCGNIWVVDPRARTLTILQFDVALTLGEADVFDGAPLFPGLDLAVGSLFP